MSQSCSIYTDASAIYQEKSGDARNSIGVVWGWVRTSKDPGALVLSCGTEWSSTTCNSSYGEFLAVLHALESIPKHWTGTIYSDYQQAIEWFFEGKKLPIRLQEYEKRVYRAQKLIAQRGIQGEKITSHVPWDKTKHPLNNFIDIVCRDYSRKNRTNKGEYCKYTSDLYFPSLDRTNLLQYYQLSRLS